MGLFGQPGPIRAANVVWEIFEIIFRKFNASNEDSVTEWVAWEQAGQRGNVAKKDMAKRINFTGV